MNTANLTIQVAIAVLAMITLLFVVAAFFGFREARNVRTLSDQLRDATKASTGLKQRLEAEIADLHKNFEQLVQVAHLFQEGQNAYADGDYDRATIYYEEALSLQPENVRILTRLGRCHTNKGRTSRAEHCFRRVLDLDADNVEALRGLAASRRYQDLTEALSYAEKAASLDPGDVESWNYLGLLQRDAGLIDDAILSHREAMASAPSDSITLFYLASLLHHQGAQAESAQLISEANNHLNHLEHLKRIKPLWAEVVRWANFYMQDPDGTDAITSAERLTSLAREQRNRQAVLSHMVFIMGDKWRDQNGFHPCLLCFPKDDLDLLASKKP